MSLRQQEAFQLRVIARAFSAMRGYGDGSTEDRFIDNGDGTDQ